VLYRQDKGEKKRKGKIEERIIKKKRALSKKKIRPERSSLTPSTAKKKNDAIHEHLWPRVGEQKKWARKWTEGEGSLAHSRLELPSLFS